MKKLTYTITLLVLILGIQVNAQLTDDLVGYWKLDESSGNALDVINSNDGTVTGATQGVDGINASSTAYSFDGSDYVTLPDVDATQMNYTDHSFSVWVYIDNYPSSG